MKTCKLCGGPLGLLGALGSMKHYRCRDCGMNFSKMTRPRWDFRTKAQKAEESVSPAS